MLPYKRHATGFTLVELVVTIILLSVIGVVAYTRFPSFSGFTVPAYCATAKSAIRRVQTQAMNDVANSQPYIVQINPTNIEWQNGAITLNPAVDCTGPKCAQLVRLSDKDIQRGIRFSDEKIQFDSLGRSVDSSGVTTREVQITLGNPQGRDRQITIYKEGYVDGCE